MSDAPDPTAMARTLSAKPSRFKLSGSIESDGKTDWLGIAKVIGAAVGMTGGGLSLLSMTTPDAVLADDARIRAVSIVATGAETKATEAKEIAQRASQGVDALAGKVDKLSDKLDAQSQQLNQLIGVLSVIAKKP